MAGWGEGRPLQSGANRLCGKILLCPGTETEL